MTLSAIEQEIINDVWRRHPGLKACEESLLAVHEALVNCYEEQGTLFTCGNGGSNSDATHIVGELCKSFERTRTLDTDFLSKLAGLPFAEELAQHLEAGLPAITLGLNGALKTAVENDSPLRDIAFAQELNALMRGGDVLIAISTSGNADNCLMAMSVAKAKGGVAISLTGPKGGKMADFADVALKAPGATTKEVQEGHIALYHGLCCLIEAHYYPTMR